MSVPVNVQFQFGKGLPDSVNVNDVLTLELQDRIAKLLTGCYTVDAQGRCVLDPVGQMGNFGTGGMEPRDSVCIGVNLGPVSASYCKDI